MPDSNTAHGGQLAARALKQAGVEVIFTLAGGHIMPLYEGCMDEGIRIIDVRHEQAAVHAADSTSPSMIAPRSPPSAAISSTMKAWSCGRFTSVEPNAPRSE